MKKTIAWLVWVVGLAVGAFAQGAAGLQFQGLDGSFLKFGGLAGGYRSFELRVDYDPYHFVATGKISAGPQTEDLDILKEEIGAAFSYFPDAFVDVNGIKQYPAIANLVVFVQDEPTKIKDFKVELLSPLNDSKGLALLADVPNLLKTYQASMDNDSRLKKEDSDITTAIADPWSANRMEAVKKAPVAPPPPVAMPKKAKTPEAAQTPVATQAEIPEEDLSPSEEPDDRRSPNTNGAPSDKEGHSGSSKNRTYLGIGLAAVGGILVIYGVLQHAEMNAKLTKMQEGERAVPGIAAEPWRSLPYDYINATTGRGVSGAESYNDLESQKKGAETRRNIALGLGAISIGGSIVMFTF